MKALKPVNFVSFKLATLSLFLVMGLNGGDALAAPQCCGGCGSSGVQKSAKAAESENTIVDIAAKAGSFDTLVAAVKAAGLVDTLKSTGPFTVFAPNDDAFAKIPKETLKDLLKPENKDKLTAILTYHVVPGSVMAADVVKLNSSRTVNGQSIAIRTKDRKVFVDGARVIKTDIKASNGVIHVIDTVIMPDFTPDIVDTAIAAGSFKTLVAAVKAAGLVDTLKGEGPYTVFAPSDEAFAKLPKETLRDLLKPENKDKLTAILTFHVVPGELKAERVLKTRSAKTANGQSLSFNVRGGKVYAGSAEVVKTDITAKNGVIHVIDTVLIPQ